MRTPHLAVALLVCLLILSCGNQGAAVEQAGPTSTYDAAYRATPTSSDARLLPYERVAATTEQSAVIEAGCTTSMLAGTEAARLTVDFRILDSYSRCLVHFATIERPAVGDQTVRRFLISAEALSAVAAGEPLPTGTLIVMEVYPIEANRDGQLSPDELTKVLAKESSAAFWSDTSDAVLDNLRNGEWVYASFDPGPGRVISVNDTDCLACHQRVEEWDFLFTRPELVRAAESGNVQTATCGLVGRQPCELPKVP